MIKLLSIAQFQAEWRSVLSERMRSFRGICNGWREAVINFIDWIDMWTHTVDPHFSPELFKNILDSEYIIKDMHSENPNNPPKSVILLKHEKDDQYRVVQGGSLSQSKFANKIVRLQDCYGYKIACRIKEFIEYMDFWLEESGSEIILDPHYYVVK